MLDLDAVDDAVLEQVRQVDGLRQARSVASVDDLVEPGTAPMPVAYTLVEGVAYTPPEGVSGYQGGAVRVAVYVKSRDLRGGRAPRSGEHGVYRLVRGVVDALLGFAPPRCGPFAIDDAGLFDVGPHHVTYRIRMTAETDEEP